MVRLSDSSCTYLINRLTYPIHHVLPQFLFHLSHFSITYPTLIAFLIPDSLISILDYLLYLLFSYSFAPSLILIPHPTYPIPHSLNPLFIHLSHSSVTYPHLNYVITPLFYLIPHPLIQYLIPLSVFYSLIWFFTNFSDFLFPFLLSHSFACFFIHLSGPYSLFWCFIHFSGSSSTLQIPHYLILYLLDWFLIHLSGSSLSFTIYHSLFLFLVQLSDSSFTVTVTRFPSNPFNSQTPPLSFCLPLSLLSSGLFSSSWKP